MRETRLHRYSFNQLCYWRQREQGSMESNKYRRLREHTLRPEARNIENIIEQSLILKTLPIYN